MSTGGCSEQLHRNLTSPPSLWPGRELRKYHCPQSESWRHAGAARILLLMVLFARQTDSRSADRECAGSGLCNYQGTIRYGDIFTLTNTDRLSLPYTRK